MASAALSHAETRLASWCAEHGCDTNTLRVHCFPLPDGSTSRGLQATRDLQPGEVLFRVPLALCMHSQAPPGWPFPGASPTARLAALLLQNDTPGGRLQPWRDILPRNLASLGAYFLEPAVLEAATRSYGPVLALAARERAKDAADAPRVLAALGRPPCDGESYAWAAAMVRTRAFELGKTTSDACVLSFVPWLDMLNHVCEPSADWVWDAEAGAMEVCAVRGIRAGEEVFVSYGPRDNDGFLLFGGWSLHDNQQDSVEAFTDLAAAAAWWVQSGVGVSLGGTACVDAATAADLATAVDVAARADCGGDAEEVEGKLREAVHIGPDWQVDDRLVELFERLATLELDASLAERAAVAAVRARAAQLLDDWPEPDRRTAEALAQAGAGACIAWQAAKRAILASYA